MLTRMAANLVQKSYVRANYVNPSRHRASAHLFRQQRRFALSSAASAQKRSVVFLGTPQVATVALKGLLDAAAADDAQFEVSAVVSQIAKPRGRGRKASAPLPTPVHQLALDQGLPSDRILTPASARDADFLDLLEGLAPDLCVTAAYGNILPQRLLDIPRCGTLNIHPSLLPLYRGAAPVNRCLENGDAETGVSLAYTVLALDAGPVLAQRKVQLAGDEQAPELLERLFEIGTELLLESLPRVWSGEAPGLAVPQDDSAMTHAAKMSAEDAVLDFRQPAHVLHNKVRGFAGWPGTRCTVKIVQDGKPDVITDLKIIRSRVGAPGTGSGGPQVVVGSDALLFSAGGGSVLEVTHVHPAGKKVMDAKSYRNGLTGKSLFVVSD